MSNCVTVDENAETTAGNMSKGAKNPYLKASDLGMANRSRWIKIYIKLIT